jgi:predicted secreted acid phosphatase
LIERRFRAINKSKTVLYLWIGDSFSDFRAVKAQFLEMARRRTAPKPARGSFSEFPTQMRVNLGQI